MPKCRFGDPQNRRAPSASITNLRPGCFGAGEPSGRLDVVSVGPIFADEMGCDLYPQHFYTVLPNCAGHDFVARTRTCARWLDGREQHLSTTMETWVEGYLASSNQ